MASSLDRNGPCPCHSGKKYKKCCLTQDHKGIYPPSWTFSSGESFEICYEKMPEEAPQEPPLPEEEQKKLENLTEKLHTLSQPQEIPPCLTELSELEERNPDHPSIPRLALLAYSLLGDQERVYDLATRMQEKFPEDVLTLTARVIACLNKGEDATAFSLLGQHPSLREIYPHRRRFHMTEIASFVHAKIQYACKKGNLAQAQEYLAFMEKLPCEKDLIEDAKTAVNRLLRSRS